MKKRLLSMLLAAMMTIAMLWGAAAEEKTLQQYMVAAEAGDAEAMRIIGD